MGTKINRRLLCKGGIGTLFAAAFVSLGIKGTNAQPKTLKPEDIDTVLNSVEIADPNKVIISPSTYKYLTRENFRWEFSHFWMDGRGSIFTYDVGAEPRVDGPPYFEFKHWNKNNDCSSMRLHFNKEFFDIETIKELDDFAFQKCMEWQEYFDSDAVTLQIRDNKIGYKEEPATVYLHDDPLMTLVEFDRWYLNQSRKYPQQVLDIRMNKRMAKHLKHNIFKNNIWNWS